MEPELQMLRVHFLSLTTAWVSGLRTWKPLLLIPTLINNKNSSQPLLPLSSDTCAYSSHLTTVSARPLVPGPGGQQCSGLRQRCSLHPPAGSLPSPLPSSGTLSPQSPLPASWASSCCSNTPGRAAPQGFSVCHPLTLMQLIVQMLVGVSSNPPSS